MSGGHWDYVGHRLKSDLDQIADDPEVLRRWLAETEIEGVVWHHPDGRMVKIKAKDFGIRRRAATQPTDNAADAPLGEKR